MKSILLSLFFVLATVSFQVSSAEKGQTRNVTFVNYEINGIKQWVPGIIHAKKGDTVNLKLINKATAIHGLTIPDYKIEETIKKNETKDISFKVDKAGIFEIKCHLHGAHVGGQLVVQE